MIGAERGLNALEISSISGQRLQIVGRGRDSEGRPAVLRTAEHLYMATWHNSLWTSSNLGDSWRAEPWAAEGLGFEHAPLWRGEPESATSLLAAWSRRRPLPG